MLPVLERSFSRPYLRQGQEDLKVVCREAVEQAVLADLEEDKRKTNTRRRTRTGYMEDKDSAIDKEALVWLVTRASSHETVINGTALLSVLSLRPLPKTSPLSNIIQYCRDEEVTKELVRLLIKHKANVNVCDPATGATPLHFAVHNDLLGHKVVELLLRNGARVNARNYLGQTPAHAGRYGRLLKAYGADFQLRDLQNVTPISTLFPSFLRGIRSEEAGFYSYGPLKSFLRTFPEADPTVPEPGQTGLTPLSIAFEGFYAEELEWDCVLLLLERVKERFPAKYRQNRQMLSREVTRRKRTPFHSLALVLKIAGREEESGERLEEIKREMLKLLEDGVDINAKDSDGNTALHVVASSSRPCTCHQSLPCSISMLLSIGANVHLRNHRGETALHVFFGDPPKNYYYPSPLPLIQHC
jgi:ankyrin repeat protein